MRRVGKARANSIRTNSPIAMQRRSGERTAEKWPVLTVEIVLSNPPALRVSDARQQLRGRRAPLRVSRP